MNNNCNRLNYNFNQLRKNFNNYNEGDRVFWAPFLVGGLAGTALGYGIANNRPNGIYYPPVYYPQPPMPYYYNNFYY